MKIITFINENIVWGAPMIALFTAVGVFFTVKIRLYQTDLIKIFKISFFEITSGKSDKIIADSTRETTKTVKTLTPFQTLTASLGVTLGTGNIVALGAAIAAGGAGAVFWMLLSAFLGMATTYAENYFGMKHRYINGTEIKSGAFYYINAALGKFPAKLYALLCLIASFGVGNMAQINAGSNSLRDAFGTPPWVSGIFAVLIVGITVFGGAVFFGQLTEKIIPAIALIYMGACVIIIAVNIHNVPVICAGIMTEALSFRGIAGGTAGAAISWGFRRGIFSNEAGLGSSVFLNAMTSGKNAHKQASWAMLTVFFDTIVVCTLTAFAILLAGTNTKIAGELWAQSAFESVYGEFGQSFLAVSVAVFAVCTCAGWAVFGARSAEYLFGNNHVKTAYLICFTLVSYIGATAGLPVVWGIADLLNGAMAVPNLAAITVLGIKEKFTVL